MLSHHGVALVAVDAPDVKTDFRSTADFVYARLHGTDPYNKFCGLYSEQVRTNRPREADSAQQLAQWARRLRAWASTGRDVYMCAVVAGLQLI